MAFRGMTSPVQVSQLFCICQFNFLNSFFFTFCCVHIPRVRGPMKKESSRGGIRFRFPEIQFGIFSSNFFSCLRLRLLQCKNLILQNWSSSAQLIPAKSLLFCRSVYLRSTANTTGEPLITGIKLTYFWGKSVGGFSVCNGTFLPST